MKKRTALLLALIMTLCLLASCGSTGNPPQDDPNEGLGGGSGEDTVNDFSGYVGIWLGDASNDYDYMEIDGEGSWQLWLAGDVVDEGYLRYEPEWGAVYAYSSLDDSGSRTAIENGQLYVTSFGYFNYGDGMEYIWYEEGGDPNQTTEDDEPDQGGDDVPEWNGRLDGSGERTYDWNSDLYQHDASEFEGVWYLDGDLSAATYIVIDSSGSWSYYQRAPGTESEEMDWGTFSYSAEEGSTYYADSAVYEGVSYRVFELDTDALVWGDEGTYYLME